MPTAVWHDLGPAPGACTVCGAEESLSVGEARFSRSLVERLRKEYCSPPARFVTCSSCGWRWSVRADDMTTDGVRRRTGIARVDVPEPRAADGDEQPVAHVERRAAACPEPPAAHEDRRAAAYPEPQPASGVEPVAAVRTVLPQHADRRRGRDWWAPRG